MCDKCKGTGLLPFIKGGRAIPNTWFDCICKQDGIEHYQETRVEDFDFPCSDTYRGLYFERCGVSDPFPRDTPVESQMLVAPLRVDRPTPLKLNLPGKMGKKSKYTL